MNESAPQRVVKRSLSISGHRTSVSLEEIFWSELRAIAEQRAQSVASLVAEVDAARGEANLSSALRVFVLQQAKSG
ncbi:MAG TPA: ribbon-helix-helix domain-containing protein [Beijerinckiaceae bacterium]|nr:ribbon-helix-helix domain-containing protein [Methylobacteriaceae bacterium]MCC0003182.1 ribbon-helix-helix domain-containing protein [Methylobacteriaceae bacterium]MCC2101515.1 ribbon-helix-helix domain-containing protein [Hyphomicrobiales bacterium]MCO5087756.1 ribbon-helix-helix domain-containing protein [Methylobacteriaceae bacterium]HRY02093.1 ribbon-helix-helix domain-containing protein [Beijerinckiaceae bacterium]